jgi:hypothetical protein
MAVRLPATHGSRNHVGRRRHPPIARPRPRPRRKEAGLPGSGTSSRSRITCQRIDGSESRSQSISEPESVIPLKLSNPSGAHNLPRQTATLAVSQGCGVRRPETDGHDARHDCRNDRGGQCRHRTARRSRRKPSRWTVGRSRHRIGQRNRSRPVDACSAFQLPAKE